MKRYKIDGQAIALHTGMLDLTRSQAEPRLGNLEGHALVKVHAKGHPKADVRGRYAIVGTVQFKVGEIIGFEGEVPKVYANAMVDLDAIETAKPAAVQNEEAQAAAAAAARQHNELVAAMTGITGDDQQNIALDALVKLLAGRINFDPTPAQLERAWSEHIAKA